MVEMRPAFSWDCPDCGVENFARAIVPEFAPEDFEELEAEHGVQPWETGEFLMMPEKVKCQKCGVIFPANHFKEA